MTGSSSAWTAGSPSTPRPPPLSCPRRRPDDHPAPPHPTPPHPRLDPHRSSRPHPRRRHRQPTLPLRQPLQSQPHAGDGLRRPHAAAAANYRLWLAGSRSDAPTDEADRRRERILAGLPLLRGKDLACTCRPDQSCHADELLRRANTPPAELAA
ncbi:DUF4326 domain-containing protein [Streptomyces tauricus]|uniref:DUF4326 domain-containing protein n=1 Tax=Streptomyces tauricus TaxID=68274 RepID=UPI0034382CAE